MLRSARILSILVVVALAAATPSWAATAGVCEDAAVAAATSLTCDIATEGADRLAVSIEVGCTGGVVPTASAHRLYSGALLEPTSNPLALTTAQTASRVCTSGYAALYNGYETFGWKGIRVLARNNDTVARVVRVRWNSVVTAPLVQDVAVNNFPANQNVTVTGQPVDVDCVTGCDGGGGGASSVVALDEDDATRLDLVWIGVFLTGGISLGMSVGGWTKREWDRWERVGG